MNTDHPDSQKTAPLTNIPAAWADKGRCPVCAGNNLQIIHTPGRADRLSCPRCNTRFEVENGGARVRLTQLPGKYARLRHELVGQWLNISDLRARLKSAVQAEVPPPAEPAALAATLPEAAAASLFKKDAVAPDEPLPSQPPADISPAPPPPEAPDPDPTLSNREVLRRARELRKLRNSPEISKQLLMHSGATEEQVEAALDYLSTLEEKERERRKMFGWGLVILASLGFLFVLWYGLVVYEPKKLTIDPNSFLNLSDESALPPISELIPEDLVAIILRDPTPKFLDEGPEAAACPASLAEAAQLFGGQQAAWFSDERIENGWLMTTREAPTTIYVPEDMSAALLTKNDGEPKMSTVRGPLTIEGVRFVVILCP